MEAIEAILGRRTIAPAGLGPPGPDPATLRRWLEAAAAAPDHGRLVPFRFLVVEGEARAALGELFLEALLEAHPEASEAEREKQRRNPERVPLVLLAIAQLQPDHPKIPEIEQLASAAAAVENLLIAVHASGFGAKWATGTPAYSRVVRERLGLGSNERLLSILYVGSVKVQPPPAIRPPIERIAVRWPSGNPL